MKYKIIAAVLAAVFAVGMLAACQREKEPYPSYYDNTTSQPTASDLTGDATEPETTLPSTEFEPETSRGNRAFKIRVGIKHRTQNEFCC